VALFLYKKSKNIVDNTLYKVYYIICKEVREMKKKRKNKKATIEFHFKINLGLIAFKLIYKR